jgi:hypothetical protein
MKEIFEKLTKFGVVSVIVSYSGSGDSGSIEEINCYATLPDEFHNPTSDVLVWSTEMDLSGLENEIEEVCYDHLEKEHDGWEINDGADGTFVFDVQNGTLNWFHNDYFTESNSYVYNFSLSDEDEENEEPTEGIRI